MRTGRWVVGIRSAGRHVRIATSTTRAVTNVPVEAASRARCCAVSATRLRRQACIWLRLWSSVIWHALSSAAAALLAAVSAELAGGWPALLAAASRSRSLRSHSSCARPAATWLARASRSAS
eukprot:2638209-Prymnesium_polylepis.1